MILEKSMEDMIAANPGKYIGEEGLRLVARQYCIGEYRFDLMFEDRHGAKLIVEIQRGTLDRDHTYKILDYYEKFKEAHPKEFVELMVIANQITSERKARLASKGISYKEIPESEFIDLEEAKESKHKYGEMNSQRVRHCASTVGDAPGVQDSVPFLKHPKNISENWNWVALKKVEEWARKEIAETPEGTTVSIGDFAKKSRQIDQILPKGNIEGVRYLLSIFSQEGIIEITDNLHFNTK